MTDRAGDHPSPAALLEYAMADALPPGPQTHLERCTPCRREYSRLERLLDDARRCEPTEEPSADLIRRAVDAFAARPRRFAAPLETVATLRAGGTELRAAAMSGVRGQLDSTVELSYAADGIEVALELTPDQDGIHLTGQAWVDDGPAPLLARAERPGQPAIEAPVDDRGAFSLEGLGGTDLDLVLELEDRRVRFPVHPEEPDS